MLIPKVLEMFVGREAIYQEQGFLWVRVFNLRHKIGKREIEFEVEAVQLRDWVWVDSNLQANNPEGN
jgi:hypothetical protein